MIRSARKATVEGKSYLIDAQVARKGVAWAGKPWNPTHSGGRVALEKYATRARATARVVPYGSADLDGSVGRCVGG
jgi:hypothetical protein